MGKNCLPISHLSSTKTAIGKAYFCTTKARGTMVSIPAFNLKKNVIDFSFECA